MIAFYGHHGVLSILSFLKKSNEILSLSFTLFLTLSGLRTPLHSQRPRQLPHSRLTPALHRPLQVLKFTHHLLHSEGTESINTWVLTPDSDFLFFPCAPLLLLSFISPAWGASQHSCSFLHPEFKGLLFLKMSLCWCFLLSCFHCFFTVFSAGLWNKEALLHARGREGSENHGRERENERNRTRLFVVPECMLT